MPAQEHGPRSFHLDLQRARRSRGLKLKDVAVHCGVSVLHLSNLERGRVVPDPTLQDTLAALYHRPELNTARNPQHAPSTDDHGHTAEEQARLARLEFRRHRPLGPEETEEMLNLLRALGRTEQHTDP